MDYPKLASAKLESLTTAEIGRFLVVCALASNLYYPTYLSGATLAKDLKLAKEAARYEVNADKIPREIRESSANKFPKQNNHSKPQMSATLKR